MNEDVAKEVSKKVRVLCWVMTAPKNLDKKATAVKKNLGEKVQQSDIFQ